MPHALLLSPDDQAVNAITGVLEEMSVTCERPLDGVSAAQKLNSQSFDLVLVDCENLPAAKLIFDVCRRGKNGNNPVPIAIVDGRAGLPTAFRLGAELILTKPVSKDQARTTIRSAVGRVRKDGPTSDSVPQAAAAAAAAAVGGATQMTSFADPASSFAPAPTPAAIAPPSTAQKMQAIVDEVEALPVSPKPKIPASTVSRSPVLAESSFAPVISENPKPKLPTRLSDDPVMAELERTEIEESERAETKLDNPGEVKASDEPASKSDAPVFSSYRQNRQKPRGALVAVLVLALAGGGFYAAWMYQPGFRILAQPQIDHLLDIASKLLPQTKVPSPAKPAPQPVPAKAAAIAPAASTNPAQPPTTALDVANSSAAGAPAAAPATAPSTLPTASVATSVVTSAPAQPAPAQTSANQVAAVVPATPPPAPKAAPVVSKPELKIKVAKAGNNKKVEAAAPAPDAPLAGESTAIILSSKGAEKRLAHSITPKYPVDAHVGAAEGTIVLKEVVDEDGKVQGVRLVEGNATLANAAMQAVKQWRYRPYVRDGKAQPFQTVVIVDFQKP